MAIALCGMYDNQVSGSEVNKGPGEARARQTRPSLWCGCSQAFRVTTLFSPPLFPVHVVFFFGGKRRRDQKRFMQVSPG